MLITGCRHYTKCELKEEAMIPGKDLVFSSIYFRHGTRTPLKKLELFPDLIWYEDMCNIDTSQNFLPYKMINIDDGSEGRPHSYFDDMYRSVQLPGGCVSGHLTRKGQQDSIELGKKLRQRYVDTLKLIDGNYDSKLVYSYTTNMNRTLESLQAVLKGFFDDSINSNNVAIINTRPNQVDYNFPNAQFCERVGRWMNYVYSSQYTLRVCDNLREKLALMYNDSNNAIPPPITLWETVASMKSNGFDLPPEYEELMNEIEKCASHVEKFAVYGEVPETMKQSFGKVLDDIFYNMEKIVYSNDNSIPNYKLCLTVCHDTTILALLTAMGGFNEKWPPLSSYIAFELYKDINDANYYVKVIYNGNVIRSGGCDKDGFIKFEDFLSKHENIRLREDFKSFCLPYYD